MLDQETDINLIQYRDYREYLKEWYKVSKKTKPSFSFRIFSHRAGFRSPNFLKLVMDGERNLTEESLAKFIIGLKLNQEQSDFFRLLVRFNQAKNHEEREKYYSALLNTQKFTELKSLEKSQYEYYSTWYHSIVRELLVSPELEGDPNKIARAILMPITPGQVKKSILLLESLGLIQKTAEGRWKQTDTIISSGPTVDSHIMMNYQQNMLDITKEMIKHIPPSDRHVSGLTLGTTREKALEIRRHIEGLRRDILKLVASDEEPEVVLQLNIQLIPLSKPLKRSQS